MAIKPIDSHLTYNNTIHQSKEKQNDFNRIKDTTTFLQNDQKNEIERNRNKIQHTEHLEEKKVNNQNKQQSKKHKNHKNKEKKNKSSKNKEKMESDPKRGRKIDIFV
ncbi:hypothetical protein SAMN05660297_00220 [Natronincola peptidivorans]|uniref:Uncharacterized protein n=1 Tax=Natronincola peptidivorans TaxID=426128 RepID=A0A1H9YGA9_9FIRM|nr:hypothetical protein [Natronincola peptidivorans]SES68056.1 hypothetical protein SAMN05660297_00220 [Natronincola peptidivorans]